MSLLLPYLPMSNHYISPTFGDLDQEPDLTIDWVSHITDENSEDSEDHSQHMAALLSQHNILEDDFEENISPPANLNKLQPARVEAQKEYTTNDKILQVHKGNYILNCLKASQNLLKEPLKLLVEEIRQGVYSNYRKNPDGSIEMINQDSLKRQKQVLGFLIKKFGSAIFSGRSIMSVSLPVTIFEPQSHLERQAKGLSYAPYFLEKGGNIQDVFEQFKLAVTQFIASLHLGSNPQKPFNPILGETFQGLVGGCPVYIEQISHHPPASALQMLGKSFTLEGITEFTANISLNSVKSWKVGYLKVIYKNTKATVRAQYPPGLMSGTAIGKRTFQFADKFYIFDIENKLYAEVDCDCGETSMFKKPKITKDFFAGGIWKINDKFAEKLRQAISQPHVITEMKFKEKEHAVFKLETIEGSWMEYLKIGSQTYWSFDDPIAYKLQYFENPLPSDSNFRLDVLYLRAGDEVKSQTYKEVLEELQRKDRKLREQNKKKSLK